MEHGMKELDKLLKRFRDMSVSEYLETYNQSLSYDKVNVCDIFIETDITYKSDDKEYDPFVFNNSFFNGDNSVIIFSKDDLIYYPEVDGDEVYIVLDSYLPEAA